jgi:ribosomal protein L17
LIKHERITTTTAVKIILIAMLIFCLGTTIFYQRAKELRRVAEKLVTHAKGGTVHHK